MVKSMLLILSILRVTNFNSYHICLIWPWIRFGGKSIPWFKPQTLNTNSTKEKRSMLTEQIASWSSNTWPPDIKSWVIRKDPDAGKDWRNLSSEDEMVGWHHWLDGHESEQALGDGEGQGSLTCFSSWGQKESDMTEWLNNNNPWWCGHSHGARHPGV